MKALEQYFYQKLILYQMMVTKWSTNTTPLIVLAFFIVYFSSDIYDLSLLNLNIMVFFFVAASDNQIEVLKIKSKT